MNVAYGVLTTTIDGDGFAQVLVAGVARRVYFHPAYWVAPWPVPGIGDRVAVVDGTPQLHALRPIGQGTPTYEYSGGD